MSDSDTSDDVVPIYDDEWVPDLMVDPDDVDTADAVDVADVYDRGESEMRDASSPSSEAEATTSVSDNEMSDGPKRAETPVPPLPGISDYLFNRPGGFGDDVDDKILSFLRSTPSDDEMQGAGENPPVGAQTYPDGTEMAALMCCSRSLYFWGVIDLSWRFVNAPARCRTRQVIEMDRACALKKPAQWTALADALQRATELRSIFINACEHNIPLRNFFTVRPVPEGNEITVATSRIDTSFDYWPNLRDVEICVDPISPIERDQLIRDLGLLKGLTQLQLCIKGLQHADLGGLQDVARRLRSFALRVRAEPFVRNLIARAVFHTEFPKLKKLDLLDQKPDRSWAFMATKFGIPILANTRNFPRLKTLKTVHHSNDSFCGLSRTHWGFVQGVIPATGSQTHPVPVYGQHAPTWWLQQQSEQAFYSWRISAEGADYQGLSRWYNLDG